MPEMNGIKLIQNIQKMNLNIKCILMSGYPDKVFKEEGVELKKIPFYEKLYARNKFRFNYEDLVINL